MISSLPACKHVLISPYCVTREEKNHIKIDGHTVMRVPLMLTIPENHNINSYSGMIFAQGFLSDGQSIIKQMGSLFVFILVPTLVKDRHVK